jgi:hypothetical protein
VKARATSPAAGTFRVVLGGCILLLGCDSHAPAPRPEPAPAASLVKLAHLLGVDAGGLVDPGPPPSPPGDLAAEVEQFATLDACVKEHGSKDPLVSDALGALGYDTFLKDVCRSLEAAHTKSPKPCALIDASGLRRECLSMLAITTASPEACPLRVEDSAQLGRDPTCLAVASGDVRLCAGEGRERRARCEALATRDDGRCRVLGTSRPACVRDVARWKSTIAAPTHAEAPVKVSARVALSSVSPGVDGGKLDVDLRSLAESGIVLVTEHSGEISCQVGVSRESGAAPLAPSPEMGSRFAFAFAIARDDSTSLRHFEAELPGRAVLVVPPLHFDGTVAMTHARKRGEPVSITLRGTVAAAPRPYDVEIDLETFVEDAIDATGPRAAHSP